MQIFFGYVAMIWFYAPLLLSHRLDWVQEVLLFEKELIEDIWTSHYHFFKSLFWLVFILFLHIRWLYLSNVIVDIASHCITHHQMWSSDQKIVHLHSFYYIVLKNIKKSWSQFEKYCFWIRITSCGVIIMRNDWWHNPWPNRAYNQ